MPPESIMHLADRRVGEWLMRERARKERDKEEPTPAPRPVTITISREYGAGGQTVACRIAEILGPAWRVWDREVVEAIAERTKVRVEMVEALDEHARTLSEHVVYSLVGDPGLDGRQYRRHLIEVLLAIAQQGDAVIVGRGANIVLPQALRVRLVGSKDSRVRWLEATGRDATDAYMRKVEAERSGYVRNWFGRDIADIALYDMVLRTDTLGHEASAQAIAAAANVWRGLTPPP